MLLKLNTKMLLKLNTKMLLKLNTKIYLYKPVLGAIFIY